MANAVMDEKPLRKPRNVKIDPDILHKARVEALRARKPLGEWLEEAIKQRMAREEAEREK